MTFGKTFVAAKSAVAMVVGLTRATGRPDMAMRYAMAFFTARDRPVDLTWRGVRLLARGTDWAALQEVLIENEYQALEPYIRARPNPVILDIGANIGTFAVYAQALSPGAAIHSFEPSATTFEVLSSTRAANSRLRWQVHRAAAWSRDGHIQFDAGPVSTAGRVSMSGGEEVPAVSLASILSCCGGRAEVAKLDIEGAEEEVLVAGVDLLPQIETLVVELHPGRCDTGRVSRLLRESYGVLYAIPGRRSTKPLLLATRSHPPDLPVYQG